MTAPNDPRSNFICHIEVLLDFDSEDCFVDESTTAPHEIPESAFASAFDEVNAWLPKLFPEEPATDLFIAPIALAAARAATNEEFFEVPLPPSRAADRVRIHWPQAHSHYDDL